MPKPYKSCKDLQTESKTMQYFQNLTNVAKTIQNSQKTLQQSQKTLQQS